MDRPRKPAKGLRDLAEIASRSVPYSKATLDSFFPPGGPERKEVEAYLARLRERGVRLTAVQVYLDIKSVYPTLPVAGDSVRRWLTRHYPTLLPWK